MSVASRSILAVQGPLRPLLRLGLVLIGLGAAAVCFGLVSYVRERIFLAHAIAVQGRVVSLVPPTDKPVVEYEDAAGKTWTRAAFFSDGSPHHPGDALTVLYDPDHPAQAQFDHFAAQWFRTLIPITVGVAGLAVGSICLVTLRAVRRAPDGPATPAAP